MNPFLSPSSYFYSAHDFSHFAAQPLRAWARMGEMFWQNSPWGNTPMARQATAALTMIERVTRRYGKPEFGITGAEERVVWQTPFCRLLNFSKPGVTGQPKLLLVAPLSGHYSTLMRDTVQAMLPQFECFVTDWENARDIPPAAGRFDLDDYTDHLIAMLHHLGERAHVIAVCQPSVPVMAAVSLMSAVDDPLVPLSMVLMGGPIDTRRSPTEVNRFAGDKSINWFEKMLVMDVPVGHSGAGRKVYPGFMQLAGFLSMNPGRHVKAHHELYRDLVDGKDNDAQRHTIFYDEYMAVMDLSAEFYLQTLERVFLNHDLGNGTYRYRDRLIDPAAITKTGLLTIEGERDDISGVGQTEAAHDICTAIPESRKKHHLQKGVGHYGVFSGSKFRAEVAPLIAEFLLAQTA